MSRGRGEDAGREPGRARRRAPGKPHGAGGRWGGVSRWLRLNERPMLFWAVLVVITVAGLMLRVDKRVLAALALGWGLATQIFAGLFALSMTWLGAVPLVGPLVVKVITLPIFLLVQGLASLASLVAFGKGRKRQVLEARVAATLITVGIVIGYLLGKIF